MKRLILTLLLLPTLVFADHHRGQAIARTNNITLHTNAMLVALDEYTDGGSFTSLQTKRLKTIRVYIKAARSRSLQANTALQDESLPLQDIRRLITQPKRKLNGVQAPASVVHRLRVAFILTSVLAPQREDKLSEWNRFIFHMSVAWYEADEASWHIVDAILEEQFGQ